MKKASVIFLFGLMITLQTGCVGLGVWQPFSQKPYTLFSEGDQLGRDQLANRWLVASGAVPVEGWDANNILTVLGQPQQQDIIERDVSEDWYFVYYKNYKVWPKAKEGSFVIRLYQDRVIDLIKVQ